MPNGTAVKSDWYCRTQGNRKAKLRRPRSQVEHLLQHVNARMLLSAETTVQIRRFGFSVLNHSAI